jgi:hypothetical protein
MKKKILIVSSSFHPEQAPRAFRVTELAKEFSKKGHEVHVLTPITDEAVMLGKEFSFTVHDLGKNPFKYIRFNSENKALYFFERFLFSGYRVIFFSEK